MRCHSVLYPANNSIAAVKKRPVCHSAFSTLNDTDIILDDTSVLTDPHIIPAANEKLASGLGGVNKVPRA